jgi:hypothetical protein
MLALTRSVLVIFTFLLSLKAFYIQGDQKESVHLMITVKNTQKCFQQFQSLTMIMQLELGITEGVSVRLVLLWPRRSAAKQSDCQSDSCVVIIGCTETF